MAKKVFIKSKPTISSQTLESQFSEIGAMIQDARKRAFFAVDTVLVTLYWNVGQYISQRVASAEWGDSVVDQLAGYLANKFIDLKGFNRRGLYRMKQFFETYAKDKKVSPLVTQIPWSNHLLILSKSKTAAEREFYIRLSIKEHCSKRVLERQINSCLFERIISAKPKLSSALRELHSEAESVFKDVYSLELLGLHDNHSEKDLQSAIVTNLKNFIIEFGRDFSFIGEEYRVQVGDSDFFIDLLFFHRELRCLVAVELKITDFQPEHLGKMGFYLEALDRDVKKSHENPSVGVILCKSKNDEVVEYALARTLSPAAIAEYHTKLPDKDLLQRKLHEFYELNAGVKISTSKIRKRKS